MDQWVNNTYLSIWCKKAVKAKCVLRHVYQDFYYSVAFLASNNITTVKSISVHPYVYTIDYYETHQERGYRYLFIDTEIASSFTGKYRWYLLKFFPYIFCLFKQFYVYPSIFLAWEILWTEKPSRLLRPWGLRRFVHGLVTKQQIIYLLQQ